MTAHVYDVWVQVRRPLCELMLSPWDGTWVKAFLAGVLLAELSFWPSLWFKIGELRMHGLLSKEETWFFSLFILKLQKAFIFLTSF